MTLPHKHLWIYSIHGVYCKICGISKRKYDEMMREMMREKEDFAVKDEDGESWCELASGWAKCNGLKDKQRCPFWAIADVLSFLTVADMLSKIESIESVVKMLEELEGRE